MGVRRLGFAVKVLGDGGLPSHDSRRWQSGPHLSVSIERLRAILGYCLRNSIRMYRMASALAPYASHPEHTQFHGQVEECSAALAELGAIARAEGIRLSFHPGQYTVLNSESAEVRAAAIAELEVHAAILDSMELDDDAVIVIHVGGAAGGTDAGIDRFLGGYAGLSDRARRRLVIENDDRLYSLGAVLELHRRAGVRVVWDLLHHHCHDPDGVPEGEALRLALATWPAAQVPKIHYSSPRLDLREQKRRRGRRVERVLVAPDLRAHADLIDPLAFEHFLLEARAEREFDLMLEAKGKDLALLRLREQLAQRGIDRVG